MLFGLLLHRWMAYRALHRRHRDETARLDRVVKANTDLSRKLTLRETQVQATRNWADEVSEDLVAILETIDYGVFVLDAGLRAQFANRTYREMWNFDGVFIAQRPTFGK